MKSAPAYRFGSFILFPERRELLMNHVPVALGTRSFDLLLVLLERQGRLVTKDELLAAVWSDRAVEENNLQVQISSIRKMLRRDRKTAQSLVTLAGRGYRFVGAVDRIETATTRAVPKEHSRRADGEATSRPALAVLPFKTRSRVERMAADSIADEVFVALSRCPSVFALARNSAVAGTLPSPSITGDGDAGLRYVLEGRVTLQHERVSLTVQLTSLPTGLCVWAERFAGDFRELACFQETVGRSVASAVPPKVQQAESALTESKHGIDLSPYEHLLHARRLAFQLNERAMDLGLNHCLRAVSIDPGYAPALALAAYFHGLRKAHGRVREFTGERERADELIERALDMAPFDSDVLWMCAFASWEFGFDGWRTLDLLHRSVSANANSPIALALAGRTEILLGHPAAGRKLLERAVPLHSPDPRNWLVSHGMVFAFLQEKRFETAALWARKTLSASPRHTGAMRLMASSLAHLGKTDAARAMLSENLAIEPALTLEKFRSNRSFINDGFWNILSEGLSLCGLPDA